MLNINIFERGDAGVPGTNFLIDLHDRVTSYQHTITDQFGFESMQCTMVTDVDDALDWLINGLMRRVEVSGPEADTCWEGYLHTVSAQIGQKAVTLSLDGMANRITCLYTTVLGTPGTTAATSNTDSQALYGTKDQIISLNEDTATAAANKAARVLALLAFPKSSEATQAATGDQGQVQLTLSFEGWYGTLGWVATTRTSTTNTAISTQIGALINTSSPGIGTTNAFLSTSTANIATVSNTATEKIDANTTYRTKIEALLGQGDGTNPVAWGVYEDREFYVEAWAGATPSTITYVEVLGDHAIYNTGGVLILPWMVRPNTISQVADLLDIAAVAVAPDAAARKYVGRVTCTISSDQIGCSLEPSELDSVDRRLAALR